MSVLHIPLPPEYSWISRGLTDIEMRALKTLWYAEEYQEPVSYKDAEMAPEEFGEAYKSLVAKGCIQLTTKSIQKDSKSGIYKMVQAYHVLSDFEAEGLDPNGKYEYTSCQ